MTVAYQFAPEDHAEAADRPWWKGAVVYQVYPRSFLDSNGDGIGDLPGIAQRLEHVASLGVDAVWLSPFFKSPMNDYGYDVADYCDVDPMFGTLADFDRLVEKAHRLGLKVVIDQVWSHTSDQHAWFQESRSSRDNPKADWYVWADPRPDGSPPNNWQSVFHGPAWKWDARRGQYYFHNFLPSQPDLNAWNPAVQDALIEAGRFWLDRGVDGFRLDAINFLLHDRLLRDNPPAADDGKPKTRPFDFQDHAFSMSQPEVPLFLERVRAMLDEYPGAFTVAEVGGPKALREMKAFTEGERRLHTAYGFTFLYAERLTPALVKRALSEWSGQPGEGWPSWAFSNHDAPRFVSRWAEGRDPVGFSKLVTLLLMSLRGNPFVWQGEELGLPQAEVPFELLKDPEAIENWPATLGRDGARTPMPWTVRAPSGGFTEGEPWLPVPTDHEALAVDRQEGDPESMLNFTRRAIAFRKSRRALLDGDLTLLDAPEPLVAFGRTQGRERLVCVFNLGHEPVIWSPGDGWRVAFGAGAARAGETVPGVVQPLTGYVAAR
jgi:alpha-glucosidase